MPWIFEIEQEAFSPPWTHGSILSEIYNADSFFAVARESDVVLGFVILRRLVDVGELLQIAVREDVRRSGVADLLLDAALGFVRENGLASVSLEVRKSNDAAISLYVKHGFKPTRQRKDYYAEPLEDAVEMARGSIWN